MNKDWFENALAQKITDQHTTPFDMEAAWASLEQRRKPQRRRPLWLLLFLSLSLLSSLAAWTWLRPEQATPPPVARQQAVAMKNDAAPPMQKIETELAIEPTHQYTAATTTVSSARTFAKPKTAQSPITLYESPKTAVSSAIKVIEPATSSVLEATALLRSKPALINWRTALPQPLPGAAVAEAQAEKRRREPDWWLGLSLGYGLPFVQRTGPDTAYLNVRDAEEKALDYVQASIGLRRRISDRFFLEAGVQWVQWTDERQHTYQEQEISIDSMHVISQIINADGSVTNVFGPADIITIHTIHGVNYNRYQYLDLPLLAGISQPLGRSDWRLEAAAGPSIGFASWRSGSITDEDGSNQNLPDAPYRNVGVSALLGRMELAWVAGKWSAGIGINGRLGINKWNNSKAPFEEQRSSVGLGLSLRRGLD